MFLSSLSCEEVPISPSLNWKSDVAQTLLNVGGESIRDLPTSGIDLLSGEKLIFIDSGVAQFIIQFGGVGGPLVFSPLMTQGVEMRVCRVLKV